MRLRRCMKHPWWALPLLLARLWTSLSHSLTQICCPKPSALPACLLSGLCARTPAPLPALRPVTRFTGTWQEPCRWLSRPVDRWSLQWGSQCLLQGIPSKPLSCSTLSGFLRRKGHTPCSCSCSVPGERGASRHTDMCHTYAHPYHTYIPFSWGKAQGENSGWSQVGHPQGVWSFAEQEISYHLNIERLGSFQTKYLDQKMHVMLLTRTGPQTCPKCSDGVSIWW